MAWRITAGRVVASITLVVLPVAAACSGSPSPPLGSGDTVIVDTRDGQASPVNPTPADASDDSEAATGPLYGEDSALPAYPGTAECGGCTCAADKGFCFGGATLAQMRMPLASGTDSGGGSAGDAGLPACPLIDAGAGSTDTDPQLGCNPLPGGCTDCACIINLFGNAHKYSCDLVCAQDAVGKPMTVYCPNP
jgi:hypothetical protein